MMGKKLVILSGPSCVGKGPLREALRRHYPDLDYAEPVLCHSRPPRFKKQSQRWEIHGADYYFLPRGMFATLDRRNFIVVKIRTQYQAVDLRQLKQLFEEYDTVLTEAHPPLALKLMDWTNDQSDIKSVGVFLKPLSDEEIKKGAEGEGVSQEEFLYRTMREKIERRGEDAPSKIEGRARGAWEEIKYAEQYDHVIINHAGEDAREEWSDPLGPEAKRVMEELAEILSY